MNLRWQALRSYAMAGLLAAPLMLKAAPAPGDLTVLSGLADIAEPPLPSAWPPNGLVSALTILGTLVVLWLGRTLLVRHRRRRPYREALRELRAWTARAARTPAPDAAAELTALLRRLALLRYPRARVAPLSGDAFLAFLDEAFEEQAFRAKPAVESLGSARYGPAATQKPLPVDHLVQLTERWLKAHRDKAPPHV